MTSLHRALFTIRKLEISAFTNNISDPHNQEYIGL